MTKCKQTGDSITSYVDTTSCDNIVIPTLFKKSVGDIAIASVRPSHYLLLNHWTKSNQIWCVSCSQWCPKAHCFDPSPWGPGEGPKGQISLNIIKFQLQSQFQRFLNQTLCVYSQMNMKDIKHFSRDFHLAAWPGSCPRDGTWGYCGGWGSNFFFSKIQPDLVCELLT